MHCCYESATRERNRGKIIQIIPYSTYTRTFSSCFYGSCTNSEIQKLLTCDGVKGSRRGYLTVAVHEDDAQPVPGPALEEVEVRGVETAEHRRSDHAFAGGLFDQEQIISAVKRVGVIAAVNIVNGHCNLCVSFPSVRAASSPKV